LATSRCARARLGRPCCSRRSAIRMCTARAAACAAAACRWAFCACAWACRARSRAKRDAVRGRGADCRVRQLSFTLVQLLLRSSAGSLDEVASTRLSLATT
jgi:hypothetical protein